MLVCWVCCRQTTDGKSRAYNMAVLFGDILCANVDYFYTGNFVDVAANDRVVVTDNSVSGKQ